MITQLTQETITEYASDAQTIQEPTGTDYSQGVKVGKTVPAKWWNWLFRGATRRLRQAKTDAQNMLTEMQNVVTDAGLTLDVNDNTQLKQAVVVEADKQIDNYVTEKKGFLTTWETLELPGISHFYNASIYGLQQVENVLIAALRTGSDGELSRLIISTDAVHWRLLRPVTTGIYPTFHLSFGLLRYKDTWWLSMIGSNSTYDKIVSLFKSTDLLEWSQVFLEYSRDASVAELGGLAVINNTLYYSDKYTTDGVTWNTMSTSIGTSTLTWVGNLAPTPIKIGSKYIVGTAVFNGTTWSGLLDGSRSFLLRVIKQLTLANGNIVLLYGAKGLENTVRSTITQDYRAERARYMIVVLDAEANLVHKLSPASSTEFSVLPNADIINEYIFTFDFDTDHAVKYSIDGINFSTIEAIQDVPVFINDAYWSRSKTDPTKVLRSTDLSSWEEAFSLPTPKVPPVIDTTTIYDSVLTADSEAQKLIAYTGYLRDKDTWTKGKINVDSYYIPYFCAPTTLKLGNARISVTNDFWFQDMPGYTIPYKGIHWLVIAVTYVSTNRVLGHTLYLR